MSWWFWGIVASYWLVFLAGCLIGMAWGRGIQKNDIYDKALESD